MPRRFTMRSRSGFDSVTAVFRIFKACLRIETWFALYFVYLRVMPRRHAVPVAAMTVLHRHHHVPFLHRRVLRPRYRRNRRCQPSTDYVLGTKLRGGSEKRSSQYVISSGVSPSIEPREIGQQNVFRRKAFMFGAQPGILVETFVGSQKTEICIITAGKARNLQC